MITIPDLGDNVTSGVIGRWLKDVGDRVRKGEPIVEIQSDKVNLEIEAETDGVLEAILIPEGDSAPIGTEIGRLGQGSNLQTPGAETSVLAPATAPETQAPPAVTSLQEPPPPIPPTPTMGVPAAPPHRPAPASYDEAGVPGARLVSPAARQLAETYGLNPEDVPGSGFGGTVQLTDIRAALEREPREHIAVPAALGGPAVAVPRPPAIEPAANPSQPTEAGLRPLSPIRRAIATAMTRSRAEIPDAWTSVEIDMSGVSKRRDAMKAAFAQRTGANLTFVAFFAEAAVAALAEVPQVNSSWTDEGVRVHGSINLGIAVAGPRGLVVPV
ncbi:MAG: 2-oxo acid dehydrogenase subunit E2, partial [Chloroflexota bacterium]